MYSFQILNTWASMKIAPTLLPIFSEQSKEEFTFLIKVELNM